MLIFSFGKEGERWREGVGDALHRGNDHDHLRGLRNRRDKSGGVQHRLAPSNDVPPNLNATVASRRGGIATG